VRGRLARYKVPRRFEVCDELPLTSTGKVQKFVLRQRELASRPG
jgi:acyl-CoA synthetase (AMP-forming)/AMP-acid ligase II